MEYGDYILPHQKIVVERKTFSDFISSWQRERTGKKRLYDQVQGCLDHYGENADRIIIFIEDGLRVIPDATNKCLWYLPDKPDAIRVKKSAKGFDYGQAFYLQRRNVHPNAWTAIIAGLTRMGIEIVMTWNAEHATEKMLGWIAGKRKDPIRPVRGSRLQKTLPDAQRFLLEGLPGISGAFSDRILNKFGQPIEALKALATKSIKELGVKRFVGKNLEVIQKILTTEYSPTEKDNS